MPWPRDVAVKFPGPRVTPGVAAYLTRRAKELKVPVYVLLGRIADEWCRKDYLDPIDLHLESDENGRCLTCGTSYDERDRLASELWEVEF